MLTHESPRWFGFLEDIMPAGASRRFWVGYLGIHDLPAGRQDAELLARGTIAPVGNLRIKEAVPDDSLRDTLVALLQTQYRVRELGETFDTQAFVIEWVRRDLLNIAFGNSDNHGRNMALLKPPEGTGLAPVYDFAPMRADPEGITRTTQWGPPLEVGGEYDWRAIADSLADLVDPERLMEALRGLAADLEGVGERLAARGVPARILDMPAVGLRSVETRLDRWGLR